MAARRSRCGYTFDDIECQELGAHFCEPRANKAQAFFEELLFHTKGVYARQRFILADWQRDGIIRPLFGRVVWSDESGGYRRQYRIAWIEIARKALVLDTPVLTVDRGWMPIRDILVGDRVFSIDGQPQLVDYVSPTFTEPAFRVSSRFGKSLIAGGDHNWVVKDRRTPRGALRQPDGTRLKADYPTRVLTTDELTAAGLQGARKLYRFALPRNGSLKLDSPALPVDPYCLGVWLGDGTSKSGAITSHEDDQPFMRAQFEAVGYETRDTSHPQVFYVQKFMTALRALGVLHNKHVPEAYLLSSEADRLELLRGLMDTDGWASVKGVNSLIYGFCSKLPNLADAVEYLARSLGYHTRRSLKRVRLPGTDRFGEYAEIHFTAVDRLPNPHRLPRKAEKTRASQFRSQDDSITSIEPVGVRQTCCIGVETGVFLAGRDLMPTGNSGKSELLAGIMLMLLVGDGEESAEIFGVARNRDQASLVFDVAAQMVRFSPILAKRLKITPHRKRIFDIQTNSFYQVIAADAQSALGSNPSGVGADEILAWRDGSMWDSLRTGMGSGARRQPLMVAATTAGNDSESFAGLMHKEMERISEDPDRNPHTFVFLRNTPVEADPWDETVWPMANPALGDFLSIESMREEALEARNNPIAEMAFRQFRLNQWQNSTVRWMRMHLWDKCNGTVYGSASATLDAFAGRECWFGLDLAARQDLAAMCYLFPTEGSIDLAWRFWAPEAAVARLDQLNSDRFSRWARDGWLTITAGDVLDFEKVYSDIESDARRFTILGGDADKWSSDPVIQEIESRTYVQEIFAYSNDFTHMSDGMHRIFEMVIAGEVRHHGNPLARFCFDACEARVAKYDPDLIRPDKPNRTTAAKRIDAVPAAIMAVNAWHTRGQKVMSIYATGSDVFTV